MTPDDDAPPEGGERAGEYEGWERPGASAGATDASDPDRESDPDEGWGPPPTMREPLFRDRLRERLGVTPRQWYLVETLLLVAPYPLFVAVYLAFPVNDTLFVLVTLAYSLFATYVGFLS